MIIPGFTNYDISEAGVVTHLPSGRIIKCRSSRVKGFYTYLTVSLIDDNGIRHICSVLRLLALAYIEKPDEPCMARAKDGNNANIALSNIEWAPYHEVTKRNWERGKMAGRKPRKSSVTEEFISLLYDTLCLYDTPTTLTELSNVLEVPYSLVRYSMIALITRGKAVKHKKGFEAIQ